MIRVIVEKPIQRPMIPATPAKTGGAGTGNLNAANTTPHPKPVITDKNISFIFNSFYLLNKILMEQTCLIN